MGGVEGGDALQVRECKAAQWKMGKLQGGGASTANPEVRTRERAGQLWESILPNVSEGYFQVSRRWVNLSPFLSSVVLLRCRVIVKNGSDADSPQLQQQPGIMPELAEPACTVSGISLRLQRAPPGQLPESGAGRGRSRFPAVRAHSASPQAPLG